ncbi:TLC domain-containing protein 4 [Desmodus rotundus]|nr:TLC domain-containing protein 4 [Desmodus rotundus]XP_024425861.1 TLC domain-containing protein 4 [Desmodus rotundus]XP_024425862.1 TLC domain-containing protein 4 [Desmodus rotundus]XP_024425863.1 TLC domain-containing protein 4 [Desmodus rotundus]XP_045059306.1 TLC domain-containing protein 4 [Desmodus rotundus]XP_045059307.1 TLC domain-containing protein 4 [Desmodus rotundus]XP_045059308.1 TLC domain-containing protein 4 [Desmodus rotundus]XP_045059309.1 TLC domain-containing protein 4
MDAVGELPAGIVILTSFCIFQLLFHFLSSWFSAAVCPGFNNLSFEKKIEWNSRVVSTCHSLVVGTLGLYLFFFDEATIADPLWGNSSLVKVNIAIASGYLISDLLALLLYWKVIGDKYFVLHHCTSLFAFSIILRGGVLEYIGNFRLLAELSSPFVNQRWFLETLKYPKFSRANVINGVLMTAVFFLSRIATIPSFYGFMYSVVGTEAYVRLGLVPQCSWVVTCLVLDVMNVMWMVKISRGCLKVLSLLRDEKASGHLQNGKLD